MERKNFPLLLALVWLLIKSGIKFTDFYEHSYQIGIGMNLIFLPFIVLFAIRPFFRERSHSGIFIAKQGMKAGAIYTLLVGLGMFLYYQFIDPSYTEKQFSESMALVEEELNKEGRYEQLQSEDPTTRNLTKEEYLDKQRQTFERLNSPFFIATLSILALIILTVFYGFLMAILFKVLNRS